MKSTWTPRDEENFQSLAKQRDEIRGRNESSVRIVAASIRRSMIEVNGEIAKDRAPTEAEGVTALTRAMILHADSIRDALQPFDSGVRAAAPEIG